MGQCRELDLGGGWPLTARDKRVFDVLHRFAVDSGLAHGPVHTIGVKRRSGVEFLEEVGRYTDICQSFVMDNAHRRGIAVAAFAVPLIAKVSLVEIIEAKKNEQEDDTLFGLNQIHFVVDTATVQRVAESRGVEAATVGSEGQYMFARFPFDDDTHVKVRDHHAGELVMAQIHDDMARLDRK